MFDKKKPHVILLRTAAVLLLLVMLSASIVAGRYARYTSTATANDSARVAKFGINVTGLPDKDFVCDVANGDDGEIVLTIGSNSEVAVEYFIRVIVDRPPHTLVVSMDEGSESKTKTAVFEQRSELDFGRMGEFAPGERSAEHRISFTFAGWDDFIKERVESYEESAEVTIIVDVVQID